MLCGSQHIILSGKVIVLAGVIIRGDLANVRVGRHCVIANKAVIRPPFKKFSKGLVYSLSVKENCHKCVSAKTDITSCMTRVSLETNMTSRVTRVSLESNMTSRVTMVSLETNMASRVTTVSLETNIASRVTTVSLKSNMLVG